MKKVEIILKNSMHVWVKDVPDYAILDTYENFLRISGDILAYVNIDEIAVMLVREQNDE